MLLVSKANPWQWLTSEDNGHSFSATTEGYQMTWEQMFLEYTAQLHQLQCYACCLWMSCQFHHLQTTFPELSSFFFLGWGTASRSNIFFIFSISRVLIRVVSMFSSVKNFTGIKLRFRIVDKTKQVETSKSSNFHLSLISY